MSFETQMQIRHNAEEVKTFFKDVNSWADEMKQMDEQLRNLEPEDEEEEEEYEEEEDNKSEESEENVNKEKMANEFKEKGNELVKVGKWKEAIEFYDKAIELNGNEAVFFGNRSYCYLNLNELEQAELDCTQALKINPKYDKVLLRRATIRNNRGQIKDAATDLDNLLQIDPKNTTALNQLKSIYPKLKDLNCHEELKTKINEYNDNEGVKVEETKALNKSSTLEKECRKTEMKSNNYVPDKSDLDREKAANEVKIMSEDDNNNNNNTVVLKTKNNLNEDNKFYEEVKPYKSIPVHHRSRVPFRRVAIEDVFV